MDIVDIDINNNFKMCIPSLSNIKDNLSYCKIIQDSIRNNKIWSKEETSLFVDIIKKNNSESLILDIGSNTGYFTLISLSLNCNVIAIEANSIYKKYIYNPIEINNFNKNKLTYYENFASDLTTDIIFDGWSGVDGIRTQNNISTIKPIALDNICNNDILLLKIDVEGAEPSVFRSAKNLILNKKIKYIIFELTYIIKNQLIQEQIDILPYLKFSNYELYEIVENKLIPIINIRQYVIFWIKEYKTNHLVKNPNLINLGAGTNILAIQKGNPLPNINLFSTR